MVIQPGKAYLAPGGYHMLVVADGTQRVVRIDEGPPENFCRPAVDPMLRSLVEVYGARVLAAILTGMGHDGLRGGRAVVQAGGTIVAQNEASSVVWGMPGAVAMAGLCSSVSPLDGLPGDIMMLANQGAA
jgi:two-component system chemotaxis response regulator CheB